MTQPLWAAQQPITVTAPAKVNIFLHITGRRDNGYHELESLFVYTEHGDQIQVAAAPSFSFSVEGPFAAELEEAGGGGESNLVCKAAITLAKVAGVKPAVAILLKKNLPIASGIGGGSSDAAATLIALNRFWKLNMPVEELEQVALRLGADVPACLYRRPLLVRGIGEELTPVFLGWEAGILLVNPGVSVSTPAIFKAFHDSGASFDPPLEQAEKLCSSLSTLAKTHNSLQRPAMETGLKTAEVLETLSNIEDAQLVRMSGSGATCFALFDTITRARQAAKTLAHDHPDWWVMADRIG